MELKLTNWFFFLNIILTFVFSSFIVVYGILRLLSSIVLNYGEFVEYDACRNHPHVDIVAWIRDVKLFRCVKQILSKQKMFWMFGVDNNNPPPVSNIPTPNNIQYLP